MPATVDMEMSNVNVTEQEECTICMDSEHGEVLLSMVCCGKSIHKGCLLEWAVKRPPNTTLRCPFCTRAIVDFFGYLRLTGLDASKRAIINALAMRTHIDEEERTRVIRCVFCMNVLCIFIICIFIVLLIWSYLPD